MVKKLCVKIFLVQVFVSTSFGFSDLSEQADYFQDLFSNPKSNTSISTSDYNQAETRPKAVLKGVFYFGGSTKVNNLLNEKFQQKLCTDGFAAVYSVYKSVNEQIKCSGNQLPYIHIGEAEVNQEEGDRVYELLESIYEIIQANGQSGAIYLHCNYGVHASNTIAQMVLKQFCGTTSEQALSNWDKVDLFDSLGPVNTPIELKKVKDFIPYEKFKITKDQQSILCY